MRQRSKDGLCLGVEHLKAKRGLCLYWSCPDITHASPTEAQYLITHEYCMWRDPYLTFWRWWHLKHCILKYEDPCERIWKIHFTVFQKNTYEVELSTGTSGSSGFKPEQTEVFNITTHNTTILTKPIKDMCMDFVCLLLRFSQKFVFLKLDNNTELRWILNNKRLTSWRGWSAGVVREPEWRETWWWCTSSRESSTLQLAAGFNWTVHSESNYHSRRNLFQPPGVCLSLSLPVWIRDIKGLVHPD